MFIYLASLVLVCSLLPCADMPTKLTITFYNVMLFFAVQLCDVNVESATALSSVSGDSAGARLTCPLDGQISYGFSLLYSSDEPTESCYASSVANSPEGSISACPFGSSSCEASSCSISSVSSRYFSVATCSAPVCPPAPSVAGANPMYSRPLLADGSIAQGTTAEYSCGEGLEESHTYPLECSDGSWALQQAPDAWVSKPSGLHSPFPPPILHLLLMTNSSCSTTNPSLPCLSELVNGSYSCS